MNHIFSDEIQREYKQITPPPQLEKLVRQAIRKALWEKRRKTLLAVGRYASVAAAAFLITLTTFANLSPQMAYALGEMAVIGPLAKAVTVREYQDQRSHAEAFLITPQLDPQAVDSLPPEGVEALNQAMEAYTAEMMGEYESLLSQWGEDPYVSVSSAYEIVTDSDTMFSIRVDHSLIMASSRNSCRIFHLDKETGKLLSLSDLFPADSNWEPVLRQEVIRQMEERNASEESDLYFPEQLTEITADQNFYWNEQGELVLVFSEYEVAAGVANMPEFVIPQEILTELKK